jgi:hypothetical protein
MESIQRETYEGYSIRSSPCKYAKDRWRVRVDVETFRNRVLSIMTEVLGDERSTSDEAHRAGLALGRAIIGKQESNAEILTSREYSKVREMRRWNAFPCQYK